MEKLGLSLLTLGFVLAFSACSSDAMEISSSGEEANYTSTSTGYSEEINNPEDQDASGENQDDFADSIIESSSDETMSSGNEGSAINSITNFETDCIKIYCDENEFATPTEITDPAVISEIINAIDVSSWKEAGLEDEISAEPAYYIDFCNGTVLSMLADTGYGSVGTGLRVEYDENGNLSSSGLENSKGTYYYNDGLYEVIRKVLAENR